MNRQMKRMQRRQARAAVDRAQAAVAARRQAVQERQRRRTPPRQFLREVRQELRKVNWPTRRELAAYTVVVLVSVTVLTAFVFGLDFVFAKAVLRLLGSG